MLKKVCERLQLLVSSAEEADNIAIEFFDRGDLKMSHLPESMRTGRSGKLSFKFAVRLFYQRCENGDGPL
jgi:hypothetical protein